MATYIPRLARIAASGGRTAAEQPDTDTDRATARVNIETLAALVPQVRHRLTIGRQLSNEAVLASLIAIARHPSQAARWRAARSSTLGQHLTTGGRDVRHALVTLLALLPKPHL